MPVYHPGWEGQECVCVCVGRGGGALAFKGKMLIRIQCGIRKGSFVHYDMFLPVSFPAKNKETNKTCTSVFNSLFSAGYNS